MSLETTRFNTPEIRQRFEADDYDWGQVKSRLEEIAAQEAIDTRLEDLAGNIDAGYDYLKWLIDNQAETDTPLSERTISSLADARELGRDIANLSTDELKDIAQEWATNATGIIWGKIEEWVDSFISSKLWIFSDIFKGFGERFKAIFTAIASVFWIKNLFGEEEVEDTTTPVSVTPENKENPVVANEEAIDEENSATENLTENPETLRGNTTLAGYKIITELSGLDYWKNSSELGIISAMWTFSLGEVKATLGSDKSFQNQFGERMNDFSEESIATVILGIIGPVNEEFFESRLNPDNLQNLLLNENGDYTELARQYFTIEELESITSSAYSYERVKLPLLGRLSAISLYSLMWTVGRNAQQYMSEWSENLKVFLLSDETLQTVSSLFSENKNTHELYPERLSQVFNSLLWGKESFNKSADQLAKEVEPNIEIGSEDYEKLEDLIAYKNIVLQEIPEQFSHNTTGFSDAFNGSMTWGKLIFLYVSTDGKSPSELQWYEKAILYSWIHSIIPADTQSNYFLNLAEDLHSNSDEDSQILTVLLSRLVWNSLDGDINMFQRAKWAVDNVAEGTFGLDQIEDERYRRLAIMWVEIWGLAFLIKLFSRMPVMRAVILATSWVVVASVIFGVKQWLHISLQWEVREYYLSYLDSIAAATNHNNKETLIAAIESQELTATQFGQEVLSIDLEGIAQGVFWDKRITS